MKLAIALFLVLNASAAFALNEVECRGSAYKIHYGFTVDALPDGSTQKKAFFSRKGIGPSGSWPFAVDRFVSGYRVRYIGKHLDMDIDLGTDDIPRGGRTYVGTLNKYSHYLTIRMLCQFSTGL